MRCPVISVLQNITPVLHLLKQVFKTPFSGVEHQIFEVNDSSLSGSLIPGYPNIPLGIIIVDFLLESLDIWQDNLSKPKRIG